MNTHKILKIGLTGGIGSGKSTVAKYFAKLGVPIIDADLITHELMEKDTSVRKHLVAYFGNDILDTQQNINRKKLRAIVFNDPTKLKWLENLLHPLIEKEMLECAQKIKQPYCIFVIPLLLEKQKGYLVDRILVVNAPPEKQIARAIKRDETSAEEIKKIVNTQLKPQKRLTVAHDIINNDGSLSDLHRKVTTLHKKYLTLTNG